MSRFVVMMLAGLAAASPARGELPPPPKWVLDTVVPLVGPMRGNTCPAGKTPEQILKDFRPDFAEWSILPRLTSHPLRPRKAANPHEYEEFDIRHKRWRNAWTAAFKPDEDHGVAVNRYGKLMPHRAWGGEKGGRWYMCHHAPAWRAFHRATVAAVAKDPTVDLIRQDNIGVPMGIAGGGFCKWCAQGFRAYLAKHFDADALKRLGVGDARSFDPRAYFASKRYWGAPERALDDPIVIAYIDYQATSNLDVWRDDVRAAKRIRPALPIGGNLNQAHKHLGCYATVLLPPLNDFVFVEAGSALRYPDNPNRVSYRLLRAAADYRKPLWSWCSGPAETWLFNRPNSARLFLAECFADAAVPYFQMNAMCWSRERGVFVQRVRPDVYEVMKTVAAFAREHRSWFTRRGRNVADVALVYSIPSFLYKQNAPLGFHVRAPYYARQRQAFMFAADTLDAMHVPFNVEIFEGQPALWRRPAASGRLLDVLRRYRLVVLPNVEAISDAQVAALRQYVAEGGHVLLFGDTGLRDESFRKRPRPALESLESPDKVVDLGPKLLDDLTRAARHVDMGAKQVVVLNQRRPRNLVVSGWSKAEDVQPLGSPGGYSIWTDVIYADGTKLHAQNAVFRPGAHDWQFSKRTIRVTKPVKLIKVYAMFRSHTGVAWFDDLALCEEGEERNLLRAPGFEDEGWERFGKGFEYDATTRRGGRRSLRVANRRDARVLRDVRRTLETATTCLLPGHLLIETNAPASVFISPFKIERGFLLHFVNYAYDSLTDAVRPQSNLRVAWRLPPAARSREWKVRYAAPGASERTLSSETRDGIVRFVLPRLGVWAVVSLE